MMGTDIFEIDASWGEKLTKTRVQFLLTPTVIQLGIMIGGFFQNKLRPNDQASKLATKTPR